MHDPADFFQVGGILAADAPSYIFRAADRELVEVLARGELCLVLAPRQTGKSSLMVQACRQLNARDIRSAIVDLQALGSQTDAAVWFSDALYQIERSLGLETDSGRWWEAHRRLGPTQRFMTFLEDVVLGEVVGNVAIFFDEIDSLLSLPFSDDFFTSLRTLYNAKASKPDLKRLTFALLGVATPSEFMMNRSRTPFNIGKEIELGDFSAEALEPHQKAMGPQSKSLIDRIFYWTGGQPLMVQQLAAKVCDWECRQRTPQMLDQAVREGYLDAKIESVTHLTFIRNYLLERVRDVRKTLLTYRTVLAGNSVAYDEQSPVHNRLKLAGVVRTEAGKLRSRNRIYETVFDEAWVKANMPRNLWKTTAVGATSVLFMVLLWFFLVQPVFFPKFARSFLRQDLYYTDNGSLSPEIDFPSEGVGLTQGAADITKVVINQHVIWSSADSNSKNKRLIFNPDQLEIGKNEYKIRFYGKLWKQNWQSTLTVVYYPERLWRLAESPEMVQLPAGEFIMGCGEKDPDCEDDEKPVHRVALDAFWVGKYEVTQSLWEGIMGSNPSNYENEGRLPVNRVSWHHALEFIRRLNRKTGQNYRLPTEAEWEYACRAGTTTVYHWGDRAECDKANYGVGLSDECEDRNPGRPVKVGTFAPNAWGIYDMHGNVWEWCQDWYGSGYYRGSPAHNPPGPSTGSSRVVRGGGWYSLAVNCRSAFRNGFDPGLRNDGLGFRLARSLP